MDWSSIYERADVPDFEQLLRNPDEWQTILALRIREIVGTGSLLEAGCAYGLTSLLAGAQSRRVLLDLEPKAIEIAQALFAYAGQEARFVVGDLFAMPFGNDSFDVVFNAGVLEHFDFSGRRAALLEMIRVTKPGGKICVAVPNHYSIPYRTAYDYRKARGKWPFPDEEIIFDFSAELAGSPGVVQLSRVTVAPESSLYYLPKYLKIGFKLLAAIRKFEGYLSIITLEKASPLPGA